MYYSQVIKVSKEDVIFLNKVLHTGTTHGFKDNEVVDVRTVRFDNGFEVDIKTVNGGRDSFGYIDAVLFDEGGGEIYALEPAFDEILGEYKFYLENDTFSVTVVSI